MHDGLWNPAGTADVEKLHLPPPTDGELWVQRITTADANPFGGSVPLQFGPKPGADVLRALKGEEELLTAGWYFWRVRAWLPALLLPVKKI